jgi:sphingolipid delta-4 desaturase
MSSSVSVSSSSSSLVVTAPPEPDGSHHDSGLRSRHIARGASWHVARSRRILAEHPELRREIGPDPRSAVVIVAIVALQLGIAASLRALPWWAAAIAGWTFGAVLAHALGVAIHECAHDLVFKTRWMNKALGIVANLPIGLPGAIDFRDQHLRHHAALGATDGSDTQTPNAREIAFGGEGWSVRRVVWLALGSILFNGSPTSQHTQRGWRIANVVLCLAMWPLTIAWGFSSFVYLFVAAWMAFGLHPVGARRYAEHYQRDGVDQPTLSYYGLGNWVSLNVGYHVEHHDLPGVAWHRLPKVRRVASAHYAPLASVRSWTAHLLTLLRDREPAARYPSR